ncbi:DUF7227 family protein [Ottowia thiooxydans]|uniref:DUF7227 family protein n=1 Tax=Ottowia thiooxydans TaxID=219182 RepID=UPI003CCB9C15
MRMNWPDRKIAPVVTVLPTEQIKPSMTNDERSVAVCPASVRSDVSCATCGSCANRKRPAIPTLNGLS